jgi:hypothetical protein
MRIFILLSVIIFSSSSYNGGGSNFIKRRLTCNEGNGTGYRIALARDSLLSKTCSYIPEKLKKFPNDLKIQFIRELLTFKGDTDRCAIGIKNYELRSSNTDIGGAKYYSIQVEALFIINQIYFDEPFLYSNYPLLEGKDGKIESIKGRTIDKAFKAYENWFKRIQKMGFAKAKQKKIEPLTGSDVHWYH